MSNFLTGLNQLDPSVKRFNGGGSSFTLDEAGTTTATRLVVGGVEQVPGVDFNVSGTTLSTTSATPSGTNNVVSFQYFKSGTVNTATAVATNGVNNAAMADDAIGIAELSATGTASSSTFLRGDNAWAAPAGGGYEFVGSSDGAGDADVSFTNMAAGYDYLYQWVNLIPVTDGVFFQSQLGIAGPTYRTSNYRGAGGGRHDGGSTDSGEWSSNMQICYNVMGSAANERTAALELTVYDPAEASTITCVSGLIFGHSNTGDEIGNGWFGGYNTATEAITSIKFFFSSGNIETGVCKQFRRPNA